MSPVVKFKNIKNSKLNEISTETGAFLITENDGKIYLDSTDGNRIVLNDICEVDTINSITKYQNQKFYLDKSTKYLYFYDGSDLLPIITIFDKNQNGLVPLVQDDDNDKFLNSDGTWKNITESNLIILNKTLSLNNEWINIDISDLVNGSYLIQILIIDKKIMFTGYFSWYNSTNTLNDENEIILHKSSDNNNNINIYLRTIQNSSTKLQISSNSEILNTTIQFKIKQIL